MCERGEVENIPSTKPIRQTVVEFENRTELQRFVNWAYDKRVTKSEGVKRARELYRNHTPAKPRKKK